MPTLHPIQVTLLREPPPADAEPGTLGRPRKHTFRDPGFTVKDELVEALRAAAGENAGMFRVLAAAVGLCTRLGTESRIDYVKAGCNPLRYGGAFLEWYRAQDASTQAQLDLIEAGKAIFAHIDGGLFPREDEVAGAVGNSEEPEGGRTAPPSSSPSPTDTVTSAGSAS